MTESVVKKVVLYKDGTMEFISEPSRYFDRTMIRLSEEVEVSFPLLPKEETINAEVNQINSMIEELKSKTLETIQSLEQKKQELLAIGFGE